MSDTIDGQRNSIDKSSKPLDGVPITQDAVFGEITEHGPNYRNVRILPQYSGQRLTVYRSDGLEPQL